MTEYIKKDDAYKIVSDFQYERLKDGKSYISLSELGKITLLMSVLPTTDIVHCRECKHSGVDKMGWYCNKHYHRYTDENTHFCSDGERGDNND